MMTDDQKMAFEQKQAADQAKIPVAGAAPVPPAPAVPAANAVMPAPIVAATPLPPALGNVQIDLFNGFPQQPVIPVVVVDSPLRRRLLSIALELGDNFFNRGRFQEANRQYQIALGLALGLPIDTAPIQMRIDLTLPYMPPAPFIAIPQRPRLAIFNFATFGNPLVVPPGLGPWTADNIAPYFNSTYDVMDRNELFWYMARSGLSLRDVAFDPAARLWLARAMNVRFFLFGIVNETRSFDVTTNLIDVENGYQVGGSRVHVQTSWELRLRLAELANGTMLDPATRALQNAAALAAAQEQERLARLSDLERRRFFLASNNYDLLVLEGRRAQALGNIALALELFGRANTIRPGNVEVSFFLEKNRQADRFNGWDTLRRQDEARQRALFDQSQVQRLEFGATPSSSAIVPPKGRRPAAPRRTRPGKRGAIRLNRN